MAQLNGIRGFFKGVDFQYAATVLALKIMVPLLIKGFSYCVDRVATYVEHLLGIDQPEPIAQNSDGVLVAEMHHDNQHQE